MKIKKATVLAAILLIGLAMAVYSGGQQAAPAPAQSQTQAALPAGAPVKATWPLTQTKQTFSIFAQNSGTQIENYETNGFTAWYESKTNVHIDWQVVTSGAQQQIPLKIAANDLPDGFFGNLTDVQIMTYALLDKVFVPITNSVYKYCPNVLKMLDESEIARQYSFMPDGNIYALLRIVDTYNERVTKRAWVYEPWLKLLNTGLPQTTEEFYNMLTRFKNEIPGKIGVREVVPFAGALLTAPANNEPESYLLNSFIYYDLARRHSSFL